MLFHILQYITQDFSAKSNHETAQDKTELHFAASCDTVMDIKRLFFPHVFSRALDRDQRNIKMSSSPLTVPTQDNGSHIRQDSLPRPSLTMSKGSLFLHPGSTKDLLKSQVGLNQSLLALCLICQHYLLFSCREVSHAEARA